MLNIHHVAFDGWSMGIFSEELHAHYLHYKEGARALPALMLQYKDFSHWQRSYLTGEVLDEQLSYWKEKLLGYVPLDFPTDRARPLLLDGASGEDEVSPCEEDEEYVAARGSNHWDEAARQRRPTISARASTSTLSTARILVRRCLRCSSRPVKPMPRRCRGVLWRPRAPLSGQPELSVAILL